MAALTGVILVLLLVCLFLLFRAMGAMGQRPSPRERMRHSTHDRHGPGPRATGLN
jgi:hypothetical protein